VLKTPKTRLEFLFLLLTLYLSAPVFKWLALERDLRTGKLSGWQADDTDVGFRVLWVLGLPIFTIIAVWAWPSYTSQAPLFAFNNERLFRSYIWSSVFAFLFFIQIFTAFENYLDSNFLAVFQGLVLAYALLCMRTLIVFKKE